MPATCDLPPHSPPETPPGPAALGLRAATWVGVAVGLVAICVSASQGDRFTTLSGLVGVGLAYTLPWSAAAFGLGASDALARRLPRSSELVLVLGALLTALAVGELSFQVGVLEHAAWRPECLCAARSFPAQLLAHPLEALSAGWALGGAWLLLGSLRLATPGRVGVHLLASVPLGGLLVLTLWVLRVLSPGWPALALGFLPLLTTAALSARCGGRAVRRSAAWWASRSALVGASLALLLAVLLTPRLHAPWLGYLLRTRAGEAAERERAAAGLAELGDPGFAQLVTCLDPQVAEPARRQAVSALGDMGDPRAVAPLLEAMRTLPQPERARVTISAIGGVLPADYPLLARLVRESEGRRYARPAGIGPTPPPQLAPFLLGLAQDAPEVMTWISYDLGQLPRAQAVETLARAALHVPFHLTRNGIALSKLRERIPDAPALHALRAYGYQGWGGEWKPDLAALRLAALPELTGLLREALDDPALDERLAALALLSRTRAPWSEPRALLGLASRRPGLAPLPR